MSNEILDSAARAILHRTFCTQTRCARTPVAPYSIDRCAGQLRSRKAFNSASMSSKQSKKQKPITESSAPQNVSKSAAKTAKPAVPATIQVKLTTGQIVSLQPSCLPTEIYVQEFTAPNLKAVPIFRGKHIGFGIVSDGSF